MANVFYTYVWGGNEDRGSPIIFTSKANRTMAIRGSQEGDLVFAVVSRNPSNPDVEIPEKLKGRVFGAWQISHITADTAEFGIEAKHSWDRMEDGSYRWPFALQPIRAWKFRDPPEFRELAGYGPNTHTQRAISTLQEVHDELAESLVELIATSGKELEVMTPRFKALGHRVKQLQQKHPYVGKDYSVQPDLSATNSVYIATLGKGGRTIKIGHAQDARERVNSFNKYRLSDEAQWVLHTDQPIGTVQEAISIEKKLGEIYAGYRTEPNNNEVFVGLDATIVAAKLVQM